MSCVSSSYFKQLLHGILLAAMFERSPDQLAPHQRHDTAVAVCSAHNLVIAIHPVGERRIDAEPGRKRTGGFTPAAVFVDDGNRHLMRRQSPVDIHGVAQTQLRTFIHAGDRHRHQVDVVRVKASR